MNDSSDYEDAQSYIPNEDSQSKISNVSAKKSTEHSKSYITYNGEKFYDMDEGKYNFEKNAIIADLSKADEGILREAEKDECIDTNIETPIDIGGLNSFNDFKTKLQDKNIDLQYEQTNNGNSGYYITKNEANKVIYLKLNKLYLCIQSDDIANYCFNTNDDKIIIKNINNNITFEINKTQIKIYNNTQSSDNRYEYIYDIKDDRLLFRNDNLDNLQSYEFKQIEENNNNKGKRHFLPQKQGYLSNISRTWEQKQQPMNLLQALVGINQQQKPKSDDKKNNNYKTCLCGTNCCSSYDVDVIYDDIKNGNDVYYNRNVEWQMLSLQNANKKIANNNHK